MAVTTINIKVMSEEIIKPSNPTPKNLRLLQTSLFDHVNSPTLMPLVFFYPKNITTNIDTNEILNRLKRSLSNTLSVFYPLAGRVHDDANYFNCNDEGVPYVHVEVDKPLDIVIRDIDVSQLDKLLPFYGQEGFTKLLLAIKINVFTCGGLAIGVRMSHAISDAFSLVMFVKTWASMANRNNHHTNLGCVLPSFEMWKLFPPSLSLNMYANQNTDLIKDKPITKWFLFGEAKLEDLRSKLLSNTNMNNIDPHSKLPLCSLSMVLSAFLWCRVKVACHNFVNDVPHQTFHAVNLRSRISPSSGRFYYFGNTFVNAIAKLGVVSKNDANRTRDESLMRNFLEQMNESISKILSNDGFIREIKQGSKDLRFVMEHFERESRGEIISLGFSSLRSLPVYEADFGWGKPVWVTSATLMYKNLVILIPAGPSSKDIVAYINLSAKDMAKLESDTEFTSFVSKMIPRINSKL